MAGGKVIQGIASNCDNPFPRGAIVGLDAATGVELKSSYFVPEDRVGGGVWTSPAVDTQRGDIFVTTGSAHSWEDGDSFSIVRLNLETFEIEDRWKLPNDSGQFWDGDWGSSPTLFTDSKGRQLVGAGQKDGGYYGFDRDDLAAVRYGSRRSPSAAMYRNRARGRCLPRPSTGRGSTSAAASHAIRSIPPSWAR